MTSTPHQPMRRVSTGIQGLDVILGGGFMLGGIYIVQGAPGTGKTILSNQFCFHHVAGGQRALYVTLLAENHARMLDNLRQMSFFDEERIPDQLIYLSAFKELSEGGLPGLMQLLRREIQRRRATLLVIDGLVSVQASAASDQDFKQFIHDLQEIALATDCTMLLTTNTPRAASPEQTMVDGLIVLTDRLHGWRAESDLQVTKFRGGAFLRGRHSYRITGAGLVLYPRIEALYAHPTRPAPDATALTQTGLAQLDAMLGGGLPEGSTTLVMGPSGIGKTTLGLHFLAAASAGEPGLMFGFYETPARLRVKATRVNPALGSLFDSEAVELHWQPPTGDLLDAYGGRLLAAVERRGVKRLFIDGLSAFQGGAVDPTRAGNFFAALANELRARGVTTVYSLEMPDFLGPVVRSPIGDASTLAENLILLRYREDGARLRRVISVLKVRDGEFDPHSREFELGGEGMRFSETPGGRPIAWQAAPPPTEHGA